MRPALTFLFSLLALFAVPPAASGDTCRDINVTVLEPVPGSTISSREFYLKLGVSMPAAASLEGIRFRVQFDDRTYTLDNIYEFEQLSLHASAGRPVHSLVITAYTQMDRLWRECDEARAQYPDPVLEEAGQATHELTVAISTNNQYIASFIEAFMHAALPSVTANFIGLEQEIEGAQRRDDGGQPLRLPSSIDVLIIGPLDMFDLVPGSQWFSGSLLLRQLRPLLSPRTVWVINGEGVGLNNFAMSPLPAGMDANAVDVVLSTTTGVHFQPQFDRVSPEGSETHPLFVHLPTAVGSFAEMKRNGGTGESISPHDLLVSSRHRESQNRLNREKNGVAYMYSNCIARREHFYTSLRAAVDATVLPVHALGACQGTEAPRDDDKLSSRTASSYIEDAISVYSGYKFIVAFENVNMDGYITEKLTNAFLAGAVPIYSGAGDVAKYFSDKAMINCNYLSESGCIRLVLDISRNQTWYDEIRGIAPMSMSQWNEFFAAWPWPVAENADSVNPLRQNYGQYLQNMFNI